MRRTAGVVLGMLLASSVLAPGAPGQLVYDNGTPSGVGASSLTSQVQADDFTLASATTLGVIRFWGVYQQVTAPDSMFALEILSDSLGHPGNQMVWWGMSSWTEDAPTAFGGQGFMMASYYVEVDSVSLGAGKYWLALHNGGLGATTPDPYFGWAWTTPNSTASSLTDAAPFEGIWYQDGGVHTDLAFQLYGPGGVPAPPPAPSIIPEPATLLLLGSGLAAVAAARRRRRPPPTDG